jgi:large subunit ribosomal protein L17
MRHQNRIAKLGRPADQRKALLQSLAKAMLINGKIKTTDAKAKELRRIIERLVTYGKKGTVHSRRIAYRLLQDRDLVKKLFEHIAPQYATRNGGYTRIVKLGFRDNDNAAISLIEFVDYKQSEEEKKTVADRAAKKAQAKAKKAKAAAEEKEIQEAEIVETEPAAEKSAKKTKPAKETEEA